ncbi:MAG: radical SAM protein [Deltaproteobacteria bacterium]|nr:radical SAM protein [Deltaproteobacteria bacterium]
MSRKNRPYQFYDTTGAVCSTCLRQIEAKVVIEAERVLLDKWCPVHGMERVLLADDPEWYRLGREVFVKRPEMPEKFSTPMEYGCPYDCGLCPDHMQHSCLTVLEVTDHCNLRCPTCYAASGPERTTHRPLATVIAMLDAAVRNEGEADVVQISGGEPTLHPDFFAILDAARARPIRHLMVNSNGLRIAQDKDFVARLAEYKKGFEIYLQFDSLQREPLLDLRGADLRSVHDKAIENLNAAGISTTLVMTVKRGVNDGEIGAVLDFARQQPCVRGVTLQPVQEAGRCDNFDSRQHRLTVSEVRRRVAEQFPVLTLRDIVPVPCNPDTLAMAYALRQGPELVPLTRYLDYQTLVEGGGNTIAFERDPQLRDKVFSLLSTGHSPESQANCLSDLLCCLPQVAAPSHLGYQDVFRVLIVQFMDAHNLDLRALKKSCVHMVQPDGRMIPFESYNLLYRDERAQTLAKLRSELKAFHQLRLGS